MAHLISSHPERQTDRNDSPSPKSSRWKTSKPFDIETSGIRLDVWFCSPSIVWVSWETEVFAFVCQNHETESNSTTMTTTTTTFSKKITKNQMNFKIFSVWQKLIWFLRIHFIFVVRCGFHIGMVLLTSSVSVLLLFYKVCLSISFSAKREARVGNL